MGADLWGVIHGVSASLPLMLAGGDERRPREDCVDGSVSSSAPFMSVYDVTKNGVVARSESMYKEFKLSGRADRRLGGLSWTDQDRHHAVPRGIVRR